MKNKRILNDQSGQANTILIVILSIILILAIIGLGAIYLTTKNIINPPETSKKIKEILGVDQNNQIEKITPEITEDQNRVIDPEKDSDGDGVPDEAEVAMGTDPYRAESLPQFVKNNTTTDPEKDSDGDGVPDEAEIAMGTDPNKAQPKTEPEKTATTTKNQLPAIDPEKDSDGDGVPDEAEIAMGTDPFSK